MSFSADASVRAIPVHAVTPATLATRLAALGETSASFATASGFAGKPGQHLLVPGEGGLAAVLFGLADDAGPLASGKLPTLLPPGTYALGEGFDDKVAATLAWGLGAYRFTRYKAGKDVPLLVTDPALDGEAIRREVAAVTLARDLVNTPANELGPEELSAAIRAAVAPFGAEVRETIGDDLLAANFPLVHAVGLGSDRAPRLVDVSWGDPAHPKVTLVGKGVVFDTGGLDIKSDAGMLLMKKDMGGAANALALATLIMGAKLPVRLRLIVPAVENAISGRAFRPGDIFRSRKGLTVEIGNTDAEGRLILADANWLWPTKRPRTSSSIWRR